MLATFLFEQIFGMECRLRPWSTAFPWQKSRLVFPRIFRLWVSNPFFLSCWHNCCAVCVLLLKMLKYNWPVVNAYKMIISRYSYLPFRAISVVYDLFEILKSNVWYNFDEKGNIYLFAWRKEKKKTKLEISMAIVSC